ncbi:MAG: hypothetical protein PGN08_01850 [Sphingomonas taxi]
MKNSAPLLLALGVVHLGAIVIDFEVGAQDAAVPEPLDVAVGVEDHAAARDVLGDVADRRVGLRPGLCELRLERSRLLRAPLDVLQAKVALLGDRRLEDVRHRLGEVGV